MRLQEFDYDFKTKSGKPIEFKITPDSEGDDNRGFRVDKIDAYVEGIHAGYIKVSYIPKERFEEWVPTIWHWKTHFGGGNAIPYNKPKAKIEDLSNQEISRIISYVVSNHYPKLPRGKQGQRIKDFLDSLLKDKNHWDKSLRDDVSREDLLTALDILEKLLMNSNMGKKYKQFQEFHVDKPLVDYINVFDGQHVNRNKLDDDMTDWRRQGIATALYIKAAKYLKSQGLKLHASGVQSDDAKGAWKHLEKMGIVEPGERRTINASINYNSE